MGLAGEIHFAQVVFTSRISLIRSDAKALHEFAFILRNSINGRARKPQLHLSFRVARFSILFQGGRFLAIGGCLRRLQRKQISATLKGRRSCERDNAQASHKSVTKFRWIV